MIDKKTIYQIVLNTQNDVLSRLREDVTWDEMLRVCFMKLLSELKNNNFVTGEVNEMYTARVHALFMPHGLGHYIGLDVHDPPKIPQGQLKRNTVVTVEPGVYFMSFLFENSTPDQKRFLNLGVIRQYYDFGGVRIEDDVLVTQNGNTLLSTVPRTIIEVENAINTP